MSSLVTLRWRHNEHDYVINHQPHDCLLNRLFRRRSKKTSKLRVTGLCAGNSPMTGEFPAQRASNAENVPIRWRHHDFSKRREHITQYIVMSLKHYRVPAYFFQRICHCNTFCFDNLVSKTCCMQLPSPSMASSVFAYVCVLCVCVCICAKPGGL